MLIRQSYSENRKTLKDLAAGDAFLLKYELKYEDLEMENDLGIVTDFKRENVSDNIIEKLVVLLEKGQAHWLPDLVVVDPVYAEVVFK